MFFRRLLLLLLFPLLPLSAFATEDMIPAEPEVTRILIVKSERSLTLMTDDAPLRSYRIALGGRPEGHKLWEGDLRTPEGEYRIDLRNPDSRYYRSLRISYPSSTDRAYAQMLGIPPGGDIFIHGLGPEKRWMGDAHAFFNWTEGCVAVTDEEMDEIWSLVQLGTPVDIRP